jgi:hypothetical protein
MVLPHLLLWHDLLQLLHHHCRRGRSREAGARAILWAAHVVCYLQVHPLTKRDRSDATLEGRGQRDAGDEAAALGLESDPTLENSVDQKQINHAVDV